MNKFTDRFLKVPCSVCNTREEDIMGKDLEECERYPAFKKINPTRIESYGETIPLSKFEPGNKIWTSVAMQSGDEFIVMIPINEFEKLLNDFTNQ